MKQIIFFSLIFFQLKSYCQQECRIVTAQTSIKYLEHTAGGAKTIINAIPVTVEYWSASKAVNTDQPLTFAVNPGTATTYNPAKASSDDPILLAADFSNKHQTKTFNVPVSIDEANAFTEGSFNITLAVTRVAKDGVVTVVVTKDQESASSDSTKYNGQDCYWVEMGTNIDLVDGVKPNNFTAGIFFQKFDIDWGSRKDNAKRKNRWALFAGAYEAKIISSLSNLNYNDYKLVTDKSFIPGRIDSIRIFDYAGKPRQTQTIRNWSFFAFPAYRLTHGSYNDGNLQFFVGSWIELRYQEVESKTDFSSLSLIDSSSLEGIKNIGNYATSADTLTKSGVYSHYFGMGIPVYYENGAVSLFLNPIVGASNQLSGAQYDSLAPPSKVNQTIGNHIWHPFYCVQFRLSESKIGITVTGEIRGLAIKNSPPQYTIAITKKFNLQKLFFYNNQ